MSRTILFCANGCLNEVLPSLFVGEGVGRPGRIMPLLKASETGGALADIADAAADLMVRQGWQSVQIDF